MRPSGCQPKVRQRLAWQSGCCIKFDEQVRQGIHALVKVDSSSSSRICTLRPGVSYYGGKLILQNFKQRFDHLEVDGVDGRNGVCRIGIRRLLDPKGFRSRKNLVETALVRAGGCTAHKRPLK